jgi:P4 family phage/plasmid primase-like protien
MKAAGGTVHHIRPGRARKKQQTDELITEDSVALAFAATHRHELRFDHDVGVWFQWDGSIWHRENTKLAYAWARGIARQLSAESDNFKAQISAGKASFAAGSERMAQSDRDFAVTSEIWGRDKFLLGTPGGTVDLITGQLRPARQTDYITKAASVAPADAPDCPLWLDFLQQITSGNAELVAFLQRWFGYCLTGDISEESLLFVFGPGGNGKTVLLNTLAHIMGTYATMAPIDTFTASQYEKHPTDLAMLRGARLVLATETDEGRAWDERRIKKLTGGEVITARFMRRDFFSYMPEFKPVIAGNHKPSLRNVDDAIRRRMKLAPFLFRPALPDPQLEQKLVPEYPAILRWLIDGCLAWQASRLKPPAVVKAATEEYFAEQNILARWLDDCCEQKLGHGETSKALFTSWRQYATDNGEEPRSSRWLNAMLDRQFKPAKDCELFRGRGFRGICLKDLFTQKENQI